MAWNSRTVELFFEGLGKVLTENWGDLSRVHVSSDGGGSIRVSVEKPAPALEDDLLEGK